MSTSDKAQREIFEAVREAIRTGMTVREFKQSAAELWDAELAEKREADARAWRD